MVPQVNYGGHDFKQHPCQKPVPVMKWLVNALTKPDEKVVSLFSGVSPCGIAALQLGRKYVGIEINKDYRASLRNDWPLSVLPTANELPFGAFGPIRSCRETAWN